ncbi:hypothetical protein [Streptomyces sp. NPDC049040]|uniref:hypothetical protein n=1 Tax=Streptomyces sp. NPDC049040 TaxID=3365593 RepID=UPI00371EAB67
MSDGDFGFELEPFKDQVQRGLSGAVGVYGPVRVFYVKPEEWQSGDVFRTELVSEHLPEAHVSGVGMGGIPYISRSATLSVGGVTGRLDYNSLRLRRSARALRISLADREYTYASTGSHAVELRRGGNRVTLTNGKWDRELGRYRHGTVHGDVDETDLAIALVFEKVDVSSLSVGGVLANAPIRLLTTSGDGGGE